MKTFAKVLAVVLAIGFAGNSFAQGQAENGAPKKATIHGVHKKKAHKKKAKAEMKDDAKAHKTTHKSTGGDAPKRPAKGTK